MLTSASLYYANSFYLCIPRPPAKMFIPCAVPSDSAPFSSLSLFQGFPQSSCSQALPFNFCRISTALPLCLIALFLPFSLFLQLFSLIRDHFQLCLCVHPSCSWPSHATIAMESGNISWCLALSFVPF